MKHLTFKFALCLGAAILLAGCNKPAVVPSAESSTNENPPPAGNPNAAAGNTDIANGAFFLTNSQTISSPVITVAPDAMLDVSGRTDSTLTVNSGQNLFVNGTVKGNVTNNANASIFGAGAITGYLYYNGGTLSPGSGAGTIGALTINGTVDMTLGGTTFMELNKANASATHDTLVINGNVGYGGTLTVKNLGPALAAGDSFQLFVVKGSRFQNFAATNLPALDAGLEWSNALSKEGKISVVAGQPAP